MKFIPTREQTADAFMCLGHFYYSKAEGKHDFPETIKGFENFLKDFTEGMSDKCKECGKITS